MAPRVTWLHTRAGLLRDALDELGLTIPQEAAEQLLRERVSAVAARMRITEPSARRYLTEDTLRSIAQQIAVSLAEERPGSPPLHAPRTIRTPLAVAGRTVAALAESARLALVNHDGAQAEQAVQLISGLGQMLAEHQDTIPAASSVLLQQPLLARTHRLLDATATRVREQTMRLPDDVPSDAAGTLADALTDDATTLRTLLDICGDPPGPGVGSFQPGTSRGPSFPAGTTGPG